MPAVEAGANPDSFTNGKDRRCGCGVPVSTEHQPTQRVGQDGTFGHKIVLFRYPVRCDSPRCRERAFFSVHWSTSAQAHYYRRLCRVHARDWGIDHRIAEADLPPPADGGER